MNITVVESSPHKNGSSNLLASSFIKGAEEKGHKVTVFDSAHSNIHPCLGCGRCGMNGGCVQRDDMEKLRDLMLSSDMVVFVTPLYYYGFSSQLKMTIDRWYSFTTRLTAKHLKTALIVAAWDSNDWTMKDVSAHYGTVSRYLGMEDMGQILATGCGTPGMTARSPFMEHAYRLGRNLE